MEMINYKTALREGFEAAQKADLARREVRNVLDKFKEDVLTGSEGKLLIELKQLEAEETAFQRLARTSVVGASPKKLYWALVATNPTAKEPSHKQLARWRQAKEGYPCLLQLRDQEIQFEDRTALEQGLADLLRDPSTGETLYNLMKQK